MANKDGKTEAPTPKKKADARKKGQVAKSSDLAPWMALLAGTYLMPYTVTASYRAMQRSFVGFRTIGEEAEPAAALGILGSSLADGFVAIAPLLLACAVVTTLGLLGQVGVLFSMHPLKPDFKKLNPVAGFKRLFSVKSAWETVKQVAKSAVIGFLAWPYVRNMTFGLVENGRTPLSVGLSQVADNMLAMIRLVSWIVVAISVADYAFQKKQRIRDLRMTRQEVRDEVKNSDGDQHVKQRIRSTQMMMSRQRMMADVLTANVIITNPTHYAVAIRYDLAAGGAPKVVAAGADALAVRIRETAADAGVPIVEAPPLARALWRVCEVGDEIPAALYEAVAKVLVFVRRLRAGLGSTAVVPLPHAYQVPAEPLEDLTGRRRRATSAPAA